MMGFGRQLVPSQEPALPRVAKRDQLRRRPLDSEISESTRIRIGPRHRRLAAMGYRVALWLSERSHALVGFHRMDSAFAQETIRSIRERLQRGETVYVMGLAAPGMHNTGVALIEITKAGPRIIVNNEEERFSGTKHTTEYPRLSIDAVVETLRGLGRDFGDIAAVVTTWDYPVLIATLIRTVLEEAPQSLRLFLTPVAPALDRRRLFQLWRVPRILARQLGLPSSVPLIMAPHHDNHAWFSYAVSPFSAQDDPVAIAVIDGTGDQGSISLYVAANGTMRRLYCNDSVSDSLGNFYSAISSTQGGWTWLSSEGRYMGAAAWGDMSRATNPYYRRLTALLHFGANGEVRLNRAMANWYADLYYRPYHPSLIEILGEPLRPDQLWNPDAVLRVEDIEHRPDTQDRLDKAAATQLLFEDAMIHVIDHLLRVTGAERLVVTGGVALNALCNMRLLEHFDGSWFSAAQQRETRLHLWVPPTPSDTGVPIGAAWLLAHLAGAAKGSPLTHAFYCGEPPTHEEITAALKADEIASQRIGDVATAEGCDAIADLMAFVVAQGGVIAIYQLAAETGPRALGHRSILANPCDPAARHRLNERVKYREAIRPLAPMATLEAAQEFFDLLPGASDDDYNAYNYMVLTARSKSHARDRIPAVIHADGTGRIQIVREQDDPLTYAYLKALGRRIGVEMSVNTSFNVGAPIAQTPSQAIETLRRAKALDAVIMVASDGAAYAAWRGERNSGRFSGWYSQWKAESDLSPLES
jgi:carbamoyltransferase